MEFEIANIAAACSMRGFRYMAFPPIVFDEPVRLPEPEPEPEPVTEPVTEPAMELAAPAPVEVAEAGPVAIQAAGAVAAAVPRPVARIEPTPFAAVVAALAPSPQETPRSATPPLPAERRFALLTDVTAEIRRLGGR